MMYHNTISTAETYKRPLKHCSKRMDGPSRNQTTSGQYRSIVSEKPWVPANHERARLVQNNGPTTRIKCASQRLRRNSAYTIETDVQRDLRGYKSARAYGPVYSRLNSGWEPWAASRLSRFLDVVLVTKLQRTIISRR